MSLVQKQSKFDRHKLGVTGNATGAPLTPSEGEYFADGGNINHTPFNSDGDHLKALLTQAITSNNVSSVNYNPNENMPYGKIDLDGGTDTFSGQPANPSVSNFGGPYKNTGPAAGFY